MISASGRGTTMSPSYTTLNTQRIFFTTFIYTGDDFKITLGTLIFFPAVSSYNPSWYNRLGHVTQSGSSDLAITLTALILGLACHGSTNDDQEVSSRDEPEKRYVKLVILPYSYSAEKVLCLIEKLIP